jgi:hypothetical protein
MVKENTTKLETVTRDRDELLGMIEETRATPQQYGQALEYLALVNSSNRADRERALQFMQQEVAALSRMLGVPVPGVNLLEGHQDLIEEVGSGRLSTDRAMEIAAARAAREHEAQAGQNYRVRQQSQQSAAREVQTAKDGLTALGRQLQTTDAAQYKAKMAILAPTLKPIFAQIPPSQWVSAFTQAYNALPATVAPARPATTAPATGRPANGGGNTPLRAGNPAGGQAAAPKSLEEAIERGIMEGTR